MPTVGGHPPPYDQKATTSSTGSKPPSDVKPANFISILRTSGSIKGQYTIDPAIRVPPFLLPPLADGESASERNNLKAMTGDAEIDLKIFLAYSKAGREIKRQRATLVVKAENTKRTPTTVRVYREASIQIPFYLNVISKNGDIIIQLPRSFVGLLSVIGSNENIRFSDSISEQVGSLSETDTSRQCFIGDLTEFEDPTAWEGGWKGDEVALSAESGSITVQHVDNDPSSGPTSAVPPTIGLQNVFFEFAVNGRRLGRIICKLYDDALPLTAIQFRKLVIGGDMDGSGFKGSETVWGGDSWYNTKLVIWVNETNSLYSHSKPGLLSRLKKTGSEHWFVFITNPSIYDVSFMPFGEIVSGVEIMLGLPANTRAVITECGLDT